MGAPKDPVSSSPVRSRWTKTRWWLGGLVGLFIVVAAGVAMLPWVVTPAFVRAQVERALQDDLGLPIEVGALSYHPFTGLSLSNIRVKPPPGFIRTPLRVAQLSVRYRLAPLLWGEVVVHSVTLEEAALVYESRDGRDNLTALIDGINAALEPSEPTPPRSELGPLMPITVRLQNIALGPISVELAADTSAKVSNLWIRGTSRLGTRAFTASVAVSLEPGAPNVSFHRPEAGGAASDSTFTARLKWPVSFRAHTGAGFALGTVESDFDLRLTGSVNQPSGPLPPVDAALSWSVAYVPKDDRVALSGLRLALNEETLVDARASATGLSAVVQALVGTATASALARPLGLPTKASDDRIELAVEQLNLPLSDLFPLAQVFVPNLVDAGGAIHARQLRVAGAVSTLRRGVPPELTGRLVAEQARCRWPGVVDVEQLDGALEAGRSSRGRYRAKGRFELKALNVAEQQLGRAELKVAAGVERLDAATGATTATVSLEVEALATGPLMAAEATAELFMRGRDPLVPRRAEGAPVVLRAKARGTGVQILGANLSFERLKADAEMRTDRLVDPARDPWRVQLTTEVEGMRQATLRINEGFLNLSGRLGDVRAERYSTSLDVDGRFDGVHVGSVRTGRLRLDGDMAIEDIRSSGLGILRTNLHARTGRFRFGRWTTPASLRVAGHLNFIEDRLSVRSARLALGRDARLAVGGRLKRVLQGRPGGRMWASLDISDFNALWSNFPAELRGAARDLRGEGQLRATADVRGWWPRNWSSRFDWSRPPVSGRIAVQTRELGLRSEDMGFDLRGLTSTVTARVKADEVSFVPRGRLFEGRAAGWSATDLVFEGELGLRDGIWRAEAAMKTASMATNIDGQRVEDAAQAFLEARYTPRGDLYIRKMQAQLPRAGLDMGLSGRLRRGSDRAWIPQFALEGEGELTALSRWLPYARPGSGRFALKLSGAPGPSGTLFVDGWAKGRDLSWQTPAWAVGGASGSVAVAQRLHLPPIAVDDEPVGWFGDDFEAQLSTLFRRLMAMRLVVDPSVDILAVAPRTADHYALDPYRGANDAELVARTLRLGTTTMNDLRAEARLDEGVLRIDRFQGRLWEGDFLFDLAVQATPQLDLLTRLRGTVTDINLDIPYAQAKGLEPVTGEDKKKYRATGVLDFEFGLNERALQGQMDVLKVSRALVQRMFGAWDPNGNSSASEALRYSELAAVRPKAAKIWISQNLLNVQFEWDSALGFEDPLWLPIDVVLLAPRLVSAWILGGAWVIPTVNNTVKRVSVFNFLGPALDVPLARTSAALANLRSRVVSSEALDETR